MVRCLYARSLVMKRRRMLRILFGALTLVSLVVVAALNLDIRKNYLVPMTIDSMQIDMHIVNKNRSNFIFPSLGARPESPVVVVVGSIGKGTSGVETVPPRAVGDIIRVNPFNNSAANIRPPEDVQESFVWQRVANSETYVFSAHYNPRPPASPTIVIVSMVVHTGSTFVCKIWFRNENVAQEVNAEMKDLPESHGKRYSSSLHTCRLTSLDKRPYAVTLTTRSSAAPASILKVMYSDREESPKVQQQDFSGPVAMSQYSNKVNFTVCVSPLNIAYNNHRQLIEWIEVNRLLGAERFVFYNYSTGSDASAVLRRYEQEGVVRVVQWHLPMPVDVWPPVVPRVEPAIYYFGQVAALNECLYRNSLSSRFIVFQDVDEILVPRRRPTWLQMIADVSPKRSGGSGRNFLTNSSSDVIYASAYIVRSTFFRHDWGNDTNVTLPDQDLTAKIRRLQPSTLVKLTREGEIFPHYVRSKYIAFSEAVLSVGIHSIDTSISPERSIVNVDVPDALVHHYRPSMWENDPNNQPQHVYDPYMLKYAAEIVDRTAKRIALF